MSRTKLYELIRTDRKDNEEAVRHFVIEHEYILQSALEHPIRE